MQQDQSPVVETLEAKLARLESENAQLKAKRGRVSTKTPDQKADAEKTKLTRDLRTQLETTKINFVKTSGNGLQIDWIRFNIKKRSNVAAESVHEGKMEGMFEIRLKSGDSINVKPEGMKIDTFEMTAIVVEKTINGITEAGTITCGYDPALPVPSEKLAIYNASKCEYSKAKKDGTYVPKQKGRKSDKVDVKSAIQPLPTEESEGNSQE